MQVPLPSVTLYVYIITTGLIVKRRTLHTHSHSEGLNQTRSTASANTAQALNSTVSADDDPADGAMQLRKRILLLMFIMVATCLIVGTTAVGITYQTSLQQEKFRLLELVRSQARLIESFFVFNNKYDSFSPLSAKDATLRLLIDSHDRYERFSDTGEILVAEKIGEAIHFLFGHIQDQVIKPDPVHVDFDLAQPMALALSGQSGTVIANDYSGQKVLAAYGPVSGLGYGIVAKIDISEFNSPFIRAVVSTILTGIVAVTLGMILFFKISNPMIREMESTIEKLKTTLNRVKLLSGMIPICASCKKIRDDKGYWNQIESYIKSHSEAEFSHGICPQCTEKLYPEFDLNKT